LADALEDDEITRKRSPRDLASWNRATGSAGNLTSDAHVAALALEHGYTVVSADSDFGRFSGVTHVNPIEHVRIRLALDRATESVARRSPLR
jgi:predicted nucleic acid-binding protein